MRWKLGKRELEGENRDIKSGGLKRKGSETIAKHKGVIERGVHRMCEVLRTE